MEKFKASLVVRGDLQITDKDTYAATLASRTFRALMSITAAFDLECLQYDAINAFVNATLDEEIYCEPSIGFENPGYILRLHHALYGLRRSPLLWYKDLTNTLENLGLMPVLGVNCLFANEWLLVFFYVDDIIMIFFPQYYDQFCIFE